MSRRWVIGLDMDTHCCGIFAAAWDGKRLHDPACVTVECREKDIAVRTRRIVEDVLAFCREMRGTEAVIEYPESHGARKMHSFADLRFAVGALAWAMSDRWEVVLARPSQWKKQIDKGTFADRLKQREPALWRTLKESGATHHEVDACGLVLHRLSGHRLWPKNPGEWRRLYR